jgi:hypothetical protein
MMTGLVAALLAVPAAPDFALITPNHGLVQVAGGSQAY